MFCDPDEPETHCPFDEVMLISGHWCSECKYAGCENCCGCAECQTLKQAGFTPKNTPLNQRVPHPRGHHDT
jgi:hypothetical protein